LELDNTIFCNKTKYYVTKKTRKIAKYYIKTQLLFFSIALTSVSRKKHFTSPLQNQQNEKNTFVSQISCITLEFTEYLTNDNYFTCL